MTHFYLTLHSNSSQQYYPDDTMTDFTTKLASPVELTGDWLVAISEIMLPKNWKTIPEKGLCISVDCSNCPYKPYTGFPLENITNDALRQQLFKVPIHLPSALYIDMEDLVHELNLASFGAFQTPTNYHQPNYTQLSSVLLQGVCKTDSNNSRCWHDNKISGRVGNNIGIKSNTESNSKYVRRKVDGAGRFRVRLASRNTRNIRILRPPALRSRG